MTHTRDLLVAAAVALVASPASAAIYFAGPKDCSDSGDGSAAAPFCTLKRAVSAIKAGDTLALRGTFKEQLQVAVAGTAASPVVIQADPDGDGATIEGQGLALKDTALVEVSGAKHLTLRGLQVQNSATDCVRISSGDNVTADQLRISGCQLGGLVVIKTTNLKVTGCEIGDTARCTATTCGNDGLTLVGTTDFVVSGTWVHQGTRGGIALREGTRNGKIYGSTVQDMDGVGVNLVQASSIDLYDCEVRNNRQTGIMLTNGASGTPLVYKNQIYQCRVSNNTGYGLRLWPQQATGELRENKIYNNVFFGNTQAGIQLGTSTAAVKDNVLRNNIFMNNTEGSILGTAAAANTISHSLFAPPQAVVGTDAVTGDPLFASAAFGNFHLSAGSPAIDKGFDMGLPRVGAALDIGAYEFGIATIPDRSKADAAAGPAPGGPDRGCGCSAALGAERLAAGWPLALLAVAWLLRRRRRRGRS